MAATAIRTVEARPTADSLVKPGELVDLVEVTPLTLNDRRIYNLLLENAWDAIDKPVTHVIAKAALRGSHNSNDRVGDSLERLMSAIVKVAVVWDGEPAIERVQLLGGNLESGRADGLLEYEIPARLRKIIRNSQVFARLQREVMFALSSKYALTLYEMVQKRGNLRWKASERFALDSFRGIIGVPKGKNWARILGIVFAIIAVLFTIYGLATSGMSLQIGGAMSIVGLILNVLFLVVNIYWLVLAFNGRVADWFKAAR